MASKIYLKGGPCDGKTVSADDIQGGIVGYIACGGGYYTVNSAGKRHDGHLIFDYAGKKKPGPPDPSKLKAPQAMHGWKDMQHSLSKTMPAGLRRSAKLNGAALRSLHRARKVKR